ncbi:MAG TPA: Gfo/Idh/MocA family oxidoreductase [Tepidisphaeraceae bacterium]|jgi:myo-inositol 2-dehydrogenase/D-chiro-inositol 1-dehydrogenase
MKSKIRIGVIGFGRMGRGFVSMMQLDDRYEIVTICDAHEETRRLAGRTVPTARVTASTDDIFNDKTLDAVGLFTLADARPAQIRQALRAGFHVLAEKPIAADAETEWELVSEIEASGLLVGVNLFNRNAWYHKEIRAFIAEGEIGDLAIVRVCHMTPGHMPGEGHAPEGPPFHDCGMHYVDVARWYAGSEYKTWHAQGIRMWSHDEPWWVQAHGTFENGVVFDITQGFVYGHLAQEKTHNCYVDLIGTRGICRMTHDFQTATIDCHGVNTTTRKTALFNDKKLDVMCDVFARSVLAGKNLGVPTARDSAAASEMAWKMLHDAEANALPSIGTKRELKQIQEHRKTLRSGFGLPVRPQDCPTTPTPVGQPQNACGEDLCGLVGQGGRLPTEDTTVRDDYVSHGDGPMGL